MRILKFNQYTILLEKINPITANWSVINDESSFEKKPEGGYFVFSQKGNFLVTYTREKEECVLDFFFSKESSPNRKSLCECRIVDESGKTKENKYFEDINKDNVWEIISLFFDYCDLEKSEKNVVERFLMGFSKGLVEINKNEYKENLPSSVKYFYNLITEKSKINIDFLNGEKSKIKIVNIIKEFIKYLNKLV